MPDYPDLTLSPERSSEWGQVWCSRFIYTQLDTVVFSEAAAERSISAQREILKRYGQTFIAFNAPTSTI